jgi:hypothetical protein
VAVGVMASTCVVVIDQPTDQKPVFGASAPQVLMTSAQHGLRQGARHLGEPVRRINGAAVKFFELGPDFGDLDFKSLQGVVVRQRLFEQADHFGVHGSTIGRRQLGDAIAHSFRKSDEELIGSATCRLFGQLRFPWNTVG